MSEAKRYLCGGFCGQWLPRSHFRKSEEGERCFRGDNLRGRCRACEGYVTLYGRVYLLRHVEHPDLYYVGSTVFPLTSRLEKHWFVAEIKQGMGPLHAAMRRSPSRAEWVMETVQDQIPIPELLHIETCWAFHLAAEGVRLPPLNKNLPTIPCPCDFDPNYGFRAYVDGTPEGCSLARPYETRTEWMKFSNGKDGRQLLEDLDRLCNPPVYAEERADFLGRIFEDGVIDSSLLRIPENDSEGRSQTEGLWPAALWAVEYEETTPDFLGRLFADATQGSRET